MFYAKCSEWCNLSFLYTINILHGYITIHNYIINSDNIFTFYSQHNENEKENNCLNNNHWLNIYIYI